MKYLNTLPLIEGLEKLPSIELIPAVPSRIAGMVEQGEADIGLASVIDGANGRLAMLPVGMIGCDGPTLTVRLFSSVPLERVEEVHADTDSHTSVVLCEVLLKRVFGVKARIVGLDVGAGGPMGAAAKTVLLIGDKVVTDAPLAERYPYQLDLGEAWKQLTGLPFVYAVWMCRAERAGDGRVLRAAALLDRQRRHNQGRMDWIVSVNAAEHRWPEALAARYLGSLLRYDVGDQEREAVGKFFEMARAEGLLVEVPRARWVEMEAAAVGEG